MKRGWSSDASKRTRGSVPSHLGLLGVIAVVTGLIAAGVDRAGAGAEWVAGVVLIGLAVVGSVLWWTNSEKKAWDELGRSVLVGVLLAAAVGVVQFEIDARQRDRSHRLEARQRDREHRFTLSQQGDLTGIDLANDHLASAYLAHKNLSYANLRGAHLENASLFESTLVGADLHGAHLQGTQMRETYLNDATLDGADLTSADLRGAHFRGARLQNATLPGARLGGAELNDACLASAHLRGANLTSASLKRAVLTGADLRDVIFNDDLRNANLYRAGFAGPLNDWPRGWPPDFRPSRLRRPMVLPQPHADQAGLSGAVSRIARVRDADTVELAGRRGVHVP